jgi:hypothetical protein
MSWLLLLMLVLLFVIIPHYNCNNNIQPSYEQHHRKSANALMKWKKELSLDDYNATSWQHLSKSKSGSFLRPSEQFNHYALKLSRLWATSHVDVNFVLIGACDGTHDQTIRDLYIPNDHWRGLLVEPVTRNYRDLINFVASNKLSNRTSLLQAAVTNRCERPQISFKASVREDYKPESPHWLRRQIGHIFMPEVEAEKLNKSIAHIDPTKWEIELVPCAVPHMIRMLVDERISILKVDAEGHDHLVVDTN